MFNVHSKSTILSINWQLIIISVLFHFGFRCAPYITIHKHMCVNINEYRCRSKIACSHESPLDFSLSIYTVCRNACALQLIHLNEHHFGFIYFRCLVFVQCTVWMKWIEWAVNAQIGLFAKRKIIFHAFWEIETGQFSYPHLHNTIRCNAIFYSSIFSRMSSIHIANSSYLRIEHKQLNK